MKVVLSLIIFLKSALAMSQVADFFVYEKTHKFPVTNEGDTLVHYYVFKNTGKAPLKITNYTVECHCTEVTFPTYEIQPGATDSLKLTFDSTGKSWQQDRTILLYSNAKKPETLLRFKVYVNPKEE